MADSDQEDQAETNLLNVEPDAQWVARQEGEFDRIVKATEADEQAQAAIIAKPDAWHPIRSQEHNDAVAALQWDEMEVGFEKQIEADIAAGRIAVPTGGKLTPEEIHEVEMNPWPGHSMQEAVARLRARRAAGFHGSTGPAS